MTPDEARARLLALGLDADAAEVMFDHFADSERRGKLGHGFSRIPWLETQGFDLAARPVKGPPATGSSTGMPTARWATSRSPRSATT